MDVRRVAGQQHPPDPIALGQPGGIAEAGQPAWGVHAEVGAGDGAQLLFEVLQGGRFVLADSSDGDHNAIDPVAEGPETESLVGLADFGLLGGDLLRRHTNFHLAHQRLVPRGLAGEADAEQLAHRTARAVTADEIARAQLFPIGQFDGHTLVVLLESGHRTTAPDLRTQCDRVVFELLDDNRLRDAQ